MLRLIHVIVFFSEENKQIQVPNTPSKKQKKKITIYNELQDGFGLRVVGQVEGQLQVIFYQIIFFVAI